MNNEIEKMEVILNDKARVADKFSLGGPIRKNRVQIHEKITDTSDMSQFIKPTSEDLKLENTLDLDPNYGKVGDSTNLIVYRGRSWLMQRAFNKDLDPGAGKADKFISWFALGNGGAGQPGDPLSAGDTDLVDFELKSHQPANTGGVVATKRGVAREYVQLDHGYPEFWSDPEIDEATAALLNADDENGYGIVPPNSEDFSVTHRPADSFIKALVRVTIRPEQYNGNPALSENPEFTDLSEAGLYVNYRRDAEGDFEDVKSQWMDMFARVTFSPIRKDSSRSLVFSWYLWF